MHVDQRLLVLPHSLLLLVKGLSLVGCLLWLLGELREIGGVLIILLVIGWVASHWDLARIHAILNLDILRHFVGLTLTTSPSENPLALSIVLRSFSVLRLLLFKLFWSYLDFNVLAIRNELLAILVLGTVHQLKGLSTFDYFLRLT